MNQTFFEGLETEGEKMVARQRLAARKRQVTRANGELYDLGHNRYWESVPLAAIDAILSRADLNPLPEMILCGREGRLHEDVGFGFWLVLTWYKMESGRYEVVAYIS